MSQTLPQWLVAARTSSRYIEDAWEALYIRDRQRVELKRRTSGKRVAGLSHAHETSNPYSVAAATSNAQMNRYTNVLPYDRNRVQPPGHAARYLNASWVKSGGKWWIAYQAPVPSSAHSFLSTILLGPEMQGEELPGDSIHTIVQLTQDMELGRRKADPYFPSEVGKTWTIPPEPECPLADIEVTTLSKKRIEEFDCIETTLQLRFMGQERAATVRHLLYTGWPDFGVPEEPQKLCGLLRYVDNLMESKEGPVMVGCSAGIGRTGTFIAAASLMRSKLTSEPRESPLGPISEEWSDDQVVREIDSLREQRGGMVQREEQMELIYQLLEQAYT